MILSLIDENARDINAVQPEGSLVHDGQTFAAYANGALEIIVARLEANGTWTKSSPLGTITDNSHRLPAVGVSPDGKIHCCYGMWNDALKYKVANPGTLNFAAGSMGGVNPVASSYPRFYRAGSQFYFLYREGTSGDGNVIIKKYVNDLWVDMAAPLLSGSNIPSDNAYMGACLGCSNGDLHLVWTHRVRNPSQPFVSEINVNVCYARYDAASGTWRKADNSQYTLPITRDSADVVAMSTSVSNVSLSVSLDSHSRPMISFHDVSLEGYKEVFICYWNGFVWSKRQLSLLHAPRLRTSSDPAPFALPADMEVQGPMMLTDEDKIALLYGRSVAQPRGGYSRPASILYMVTSTDGGLTWVTRELSDLGIRFGEMPRETNGGLCLLAQQCGAVQGPLYMITVESNDFQSAPVSVLSIDQDSYSIKVAI